MSKKIDANGFWYIKHNPISKEGVFPYLGHTISEDCEPNKIYKVYRPASTLEKSVGTWDNPPKPFIDDHEMLGEGFSAIDDRPVQGIIYNPVCEKGVLYADIAVYSEDLKQNIENGKKELSLGYFCKYKKERGVFKGEVYDYVQYDMVGNHIALVDAGRCGSDVKVFDRKCTMDSMPVEQSFEQDSADLKKTNENDTIESTEQKDSAMNYVSLEAVRAALTEAFTYGDEVDPKVKLVIELLEAKAKPAVADEDDTEEKEDKAEDSDDKDEEKESEDKCGKDSDDDKDDDKEDKKAEDALQSLMAVVKDMADDIKKLVAEKAQDEEEEKKDSEEEKETKDEDEDEEKESEDSDEEEKEESKKSEDSAVFVFGADAALDDDEALRDYLK